MHIQFQFPNVIMTAPDVRIFAIEEKLCREIKKAIDSTSTRIPLQYDTTFNFTGFYVSPLTFLHPFLLTDNDAPPPIPIAFHFHEKKHQKTHEQFWEFIEEQLPELDERGFIITDCEEGIAYFIIYDIMI